MNFLLDYGVDKNTIQKIKENNEPSTVFYFLTLKENVKEVINYLKSIKVEVIDTLLVNRLELFLLPVERIKERFESYNIEVLVQLINEDINVLNNV
jgi:uncharacterized membrane protein